MNGKNQMTGTNQASAFFGWRIVAAAFVLAAFGWGIGFYGPPIFLHAVRETRGWSIGLVSTAVTVHFLVGALVVANLPRLYRRFGLPIVTTAGAVLLSLGVLGWALARSPAELFLATLLSGAGWVAMGAAAVNAIIAPWFVRKRPAALAMAYNGASIGGVLFSPLWVAAIGAVGFPLASALIGGLTVAVVATLSWFLFTKNPGAMGQLADGEVAVASSASPAPLSHPNLPGRLLWRDRHFLTLAAAMALGLFAQIGMIAHLFSLLVPTLGTHVASYAMALATASAIAGRTLVGWFIPQNANRRLVAAISYSVQIAGALALIVAAGSNISLMLLGVVLFGAGIGNATSLPPLIAQAEFTKEDAMRVVPLIVATGQATYAFAPASYGLLRAAGDGVVAGLMSASLFFCAVIAVQLLAIGAILAGVRARPRMALS